MLGSVVSVQEFPSYLKEFFEEDVKCRMIYGQAVSPLEGDQSIEVNSSETIHDAEAYLDANVFDYTKKKQEQQKAQDSSDQLLKIDLEDISLDIIGKSPKQEMQATVQPSVEENHLPLDEHLGRSLLTQYCNEVSDIPTFCIIKRRESLSKNKSKQIILGGKKSENYMTSYCVQPTIIDSLESNSLTWDVLKKMIRYEQRSSVEYSFRRIYHIYGSEMNENTYEDKNFAALILETCWTKPVEDEINVNSMKLKIQLVSGHIDSSVHHLWKELKHLEMYLKVLDNEDALKIDNTIISDNCLAASKIIENIHNLCTNPIERRQNSNEFRLHNLRELNILDKLWSILIYCRDLIDLKNSISTFFRIVKKENLVQRDRAVQLVKDLNIEDYVASLTLQESLKFLVAIGCEKLKNDYVAIVSFHNIMHRVEIEKIWSKYCKVKAPELKRKTLGPNQQKYFALTDETFNKEKMALLCNLHKVSEYVVFLKKDLDKSVKLSEENSRKINYEIIQKFIFNNKDMKCPEEMTPELISPVFNLDFKNEELYNGQTPAKKFYQTKFNINSNKTFKDEIIYTIIVSKSPVFPKCIFDDTPLTEEDAQTTPQSQFSVAFFRMNKHGFI